MSRKWNKFKRGVGRFFKGAGRVVTDLMDRVGGAFKGGAKGAAHVIGGAADGAGGILQGFANPSQHHVNNQQNNTN